MLSLVHLYLGPFSTSVVLASGELPKLQADRCSHAEYIRKRRDRQCCYVEVFYSPDLLPTNSIVIRLYPFSDTVTTTITAKAAFTYYVRIPSWVVSGTIAINNAAPKPVAPVNGLQAVTVGAGTTTFVLQLPAPITTGGYPASLHFF